MKILLCGNYGAKNLGDELILEGLLETLKIAAPGAEVTVMSGDPAETEFKYSQKYSIKAIEKFPSGFRSFIKSLFGHSRTKEIVDDCDYFILGGGGLFNDINWQASIIWAIQAKHALKSGKPLIMYGQSIGPLSDLGKYLVKKYFSEATFIGVRDEDSSVLLKDLGITQDLIVTPDLAFRLASEPTPTQTTSSRTIIISLRALSGLNVDFIREFVSFCNWLIEEKKYNLKFIDFQQGEQGDGNLHRKIIAQINQKEKTIHLDRISNTEELLKHFQEADFVFAMRLHAIICAMKTTKPFLALSYSKKINSLIKDSKLENLIISHDHVYFDQLKNFFVLLNDKKSEITEKLGKINSENLEKLKAAEIKLQALLK